MQQVWSDVFPGTTSNRREFGVSCVKPHNINLPDVALIYHWEPKRDSSTLLPWLQNSVFSGSQSYWIGTSVPEWTGVLSILHIAFFCPVLKCLGSVRVGVHHPILKAPKGVRLCYEYKETLRIEAERKKRVEASATTFSKFRLRSCRCWT